MRVLVTGGAGYIGSFTVRALLNRGHEVAVVDNLRCGHRRAVPPGVRLAAIDLADAAALDQLLVEFRPQAVVHFAGSTSVGESVENPAEYYRNNLVRTIGLMEAARRHAIDRFVFSSTAAVYGTPEKTPITEDTPPAPINPYGETKRAIESALADYARAYGWGCVALRYFNAAGAAEDGSLGEDHRPESHLIPLVIAAALGRRPEIVIFGDDYPTPDGTCIRDYIHVGDLAEAHVLALESLQPGRMTAYNLGIGKGYSVREVVEAVELVGGRRVPTRIGPRRAGDPPVLLACSDKIRAELGWQPRFSDLRDIIATAWKWHTSHPDGYGDSPAAE